MIRTNHIYKSMFFNLEEHRATEEGSNLCTESCIAVLGVVLYGPTDPGGRNRTPCDAGELP